MLTNYHPRRVRPGRVCVRFLETSLARVLGHRGNGNGNGSLGIDTRICYDLQPCDSLPLSLAWVCQRHI